MVFKENIQQPILVVKVKVLTGSAKRRRVFKVH